MLTRPPARAQLLSRFYAQLHASNPALLNTAGKRHTLAPPQLMREGNKKTVFSNIADICKRMHRQPEHTIQFMFAELGTTGSIDGSGRLIIRGRFSQAQIENVLRRYIGASRLPRRAVRRTMLTRAPSRVRHLQDVQVPRHAPRQGEPYLLRRMRVVRLEAFRQRHQDWFPGPGGQEKQKQDWLSAERGGYHHHLHRYVLYRYSAMYNRILIQVITQRSVSSLTRRSDRHHISHKS